MDRIAIIKKEFIVLNIFVPLLLGGIIYYCISPDVIFVGIIDSALGISARREALANSFADMFVRNYLLDMLWAYALFFALFLILGNNAAKLKETIMIAVVFSAVMEFLQLTPIVRGTFDILDILLEITAEMFAAFIIKIFMRRQQIYEK